MDFRVDLRRFLQGLALPLAILHHGRAGRDIANLLIVSLILNPRRAKIICNIKEKLCGCARLRTDTTVGVAVSPALAISHMHIFVSSLRRDAVQPMHPSMGLTRNGCILGVNCQGWQMHCLDFNASSDKPGCTALIPSGAGGPDGIASTLSGAGGLGGIALTGSADAGGSDATSAPSDAGLDASATEASGEVDTSKDSSSVSSSSPASNVPSTRTILFLPKGQSMS